MRGELERLQGLVDHERLANRLVTPTVQGFEPVPSNQISGASVLGLDKAGETAQPKDFNSQVRQYHQWLDSIKVVRDNGEVSDLGLQERVDLMERSIIKQAHELQNTKSLFVQDLVKSENELKKAEAKLALAGEAQSLDPSHWQQPLESVLEQSTEGLCKDITEHERELISATVAFFSKEMGLSQQQLRKAQSGLPDAIKTTFDKFSMNVLLRHEAIAKQCLEVSSTGDLPADAVGAHAEDQTTAASEALEVCARAAADAADECSRISRQAAQAAATQAAAAKVVVVKTPRAQDTEKATTDSGKVEAVHWVRRMLARQVGGSAVTVVDASELHSMLDLLESNPPAPPAQPALPRRPIDSENVEPRAMPLPPHPKPGLLQSSRMANQLPSAPQMNKIETSMPRRQSSYTVTARQ